ncbi:MAG: ribosome biogenesis factor YjgA [Desulfomonilia bacterium]
MKKPPDIPQDHDRIEDDQEPARTSKTQKKKDMIELQKLGERLVTLSAQRLQGLDIPKDLKEAVRFAKTIRSHSARKRQMQFIGVLMRKVDPEPIRRTLQEIDSVSSRDALLFQHIEQLRDGLIAGDEEYTRTVLTQFPQADRDEFFRFLEKAWDEKRTGKPKGAARALFRYLRTMCGSC